MTIIIFLLVLAVLIFVHELGHFVVAKMNGIRVDAFALGFGPKILSWQGTETLYSLNLIPFGGYVKIFGENPNEESLYGPEANRSFVNKNRLAQVAVLVAGVFCNFLFAAILYVIIFSHGVTATTEGFEKYSSHFQNERIMVVQVQANSPAEKAGLKTGDVLKEIKTGKSDIKSASDTFTVPTLQGLIDGSKGAPIELLVLRNNEELVTTDLAATPGIVEDKYAVGIAMQNVADIQLPIGSAIKEGFVYTWGMMKETAQGLYSFFAKIFTGKADFSDVSGPIGIAGIVGNAAQMGWVYLLMVTALISINLGIINLVPFPALDGGRVLFVAIEAIIRRRISPKIANTVNAVGFTLLMILMVVVTYRDIAKLF